MRAPTINDAIDARRRLAPERQRELTVYLLTLAADVCTPEAIDPEHLRSVTEGLEQARQRQFAAAEEGEAANRSFES